MAMDGAALGNIIKAQFITVFGTAADDTKLNNFCSALGNSIVNYIKANASVNVTGVEPGGGTATGTLS